MKKLPVAIQMWTVRNEIADDLKGTLERIAETGYHGVELWFPEFPSVGKLKKMLGNCGLKVISAHIPFVDLRDDFLAVADYHKELGNTNLTIPSIPALLRESENDWVQRVEEIGVIARKAKDAGFQLAYHNHAVEFENCIGDVEVHDYIFEKIDVDVLNVELDTFFIADVGKDPAEYIRRYKGRSSLLHIKEKSKTPGKNQNAEVGYGTIDWDSVFAAAEESGVEWYIVEQNCQVYPAFESIRMSLEYLKSRGIV